MEVKSAEHLYLLTVNARMTSIFSVQFLCLALRHYCGRVLLSTATRSDARRWHHHSNSSSRVRRLCATVNRPRTRQSNSFISLPPPTMETGFEGAQAHCSLCKVGFRESLQDDSQALRHLAGSKHKVRLLATRGCLFKSLSFCHPSHKSAGVSVYVCVRACVAVCVRHVRGKFGVCVCVCACQSEARAISPSFKNSHLT